MKILLSTLLTVATVCGTANASATSYIFRQAAKDVKVSVAASPTPPVSPPVVPTPDVLPPAGAYFAKWQNTTYGCGACTALGNSNLTATLKYASGAYGQVQGDRYKSSGKWYWEVKIGENTAAQPGFVIGIKSENSSLTAFPGEDKWSVGYAASGTTLNGVWVSGYYYDQKITVYGARYNAGDVIGVALDLDNHAITFYKNGVSQGLISGLTADQKTPAFGMWSSPGYDTVTANFGQSPFAYPAPAGFNKGFWN